MAIQESSEQQIFHFLLLLMIGLIFSVLQIIIIRALNEKAYLQVIALPICSSKRRTWALDSGTQSFTDDSVLLIHLEAPELSKNDLQPLFLTKFLRQLIGSN